MFSAASQFRELREGDRLDLAPAGSAIATWAEMRSDELRAKAKAASAGAS
jgi:hypothetical protein